MADLLTDAEPPITQQEMLDEIDRELKYRRFVYGARVSKGTMKQGEADRRTAIMRAIRERISDG